MPKVTPSKEAIKMSNTQIVRLFTREHGGPVADTTLVQGTLPSGAAAPDAEVVMEVEAGTADWGGGSLFTTGLVIKDLYDETLVTFHPANPVDPIHPDNPYAGNMHNPPWASQDQSFVYTIRQADLAPHVGHICEAYAQLVVGAVEPQAYIAESPLFLVTAA